MVGAALALSLVTLLASFRRPIALLPLLPEVPDFHLVYRKEDESTATIRSIRAWLKEIIAAQELQVAAGEP